MLDFRYATTEDKPDPNFKLKFRGGVNVAAYREEVNRRNEFFQTTLAAKATGTPLELARFKNVKKAPIRPLEPVFEHFVEMEVEKEEDILDALMRIDRQVYKYQEAVAQEAAQAAQVRRSRRCNGCNQWAEEGAMPQGQRKWYCAACWGSWNNQQPPPFQQHGGFLPLAPPMQQQPQWGWFPQQPHTAWLAPQPLQVPNFQPPTTEEVDRRNKRKMRFDGDDDPLSEFPPLDEDEEDRAAKRQKRFAEDDTHSIDGCDV